MERDMDTMDFQVIAREQVDEPRVDKKKKISNFYVNGKYKIMASLYNFVHTYPTELPPFSDSPIYMLGKCYDKEEYCNSVVLFLFTNYSLIATPLFIAIVTNSMHLLRNQCPFNALPTPFEWTHNPQRKNQENATTEEDEVEEKSFSIRSSGNHANRNQQKEHCSACHQSKNICFIEAFLQDFYSIMFFSYRKEFPPLEATELTTDIGWGCMLRTGQMMLGQMLIRHMLGREWRVSPQEQMSPYSSYRQILRWFSDSPSPKCPYSIHNFISKSSLTKSNNGTAAAAKAGEWFTPTRVCQLMKELVRTHSPEALTMYVSVDGVVYKEEVAALCTLTELYSTQSPSPQRHGNLSKEASDPYLFWRPVIIVVPVRLGVDRINKVYIDGIKLMLRLPQSAGIIGGRPRQSLYFVGYQDDEIFFLDPHIVRSSVKPEECGPESYHCSIPRKMPIENIDPSLALGFYCAKKSDFEDFCTAIDKISASLSNPIFTIADSKPVYGIDEEFEHDLVVI